MRYDQLLIPNGFRIDGTITGSIPVIEYNDYLSLTHLLCQNLVIKSVTTNKKLNDDLLNRRLIDVFPEDRDSKYYLNLAGIYHQLDAPMVVMSHDTMSEIAFTVSNLREHKRTLEAYRLKPEYRLKLISQYPKQDILIQGILNPVSLEDAVIAKDSAVLYYPTDLIEPQEIELLADLQEWIKGFHFRWDVKAFNVHHSLYSLAQTSVFYLKLLERVLVIRDGYAETPQAHSFYIHQRLVSNGIPHTYLPYLNLSQKVTLAKNIKYYRKFPGRTYTRDKLIDTVFTKRSIPLGKLDYIKSHSENTAGVPEVNFTLSPLSSIAQRDDNLITRGELDPTVFEADEYDYNNLALSTLAAASTKWYYSNYTNYTDSMSVKHVDFVIGQWAYYAEHDLLQAKVPVIVNDRSVFLDAKTALLFYQLLLAKLVNHTPVNFTDMDFPLAFAGLPELEYGYHYRELETLVSTLPTVKRIVSLEAFQDYTQTLFEKYQALIRLGLNDHRLVKRSVVREYVSSLFSSNTLTAPTESVDSWLATKSLVVPSDLTDVLALCDVIFYAFAGNINKEFYDQKTTHLQLASLFLRLSSYSVRLYTESNSKPLAVLPIYPTGAGLVGGTTNTRYYTRTESLVGKKGKAAHKNAQLLTTVSAYKKSAVSGHVTHYLKPTMAVPSIKPQPVYYTQPTHFASGFTDTSYRDTFSFVSTTNLNEVVNINEVNIPIPVTLSTILEL